MRDPYVYANGSSVGTVALKAVSHGQVMVSYRDHTITCEFQTDVNKPIDSIVLDAEVAGGGLRADISVLIDKKQNNLKP